MVMTPETRIAEALAAIPTGDITVRWLVLLAASPANLTVCIQDWKQNQWQLSLLGVKHVRKLGFQRIGTFDRFQVTGCGASGFATIRFGDYIVIANECQPTESAAAFETPAVADADELGPISTADNSLRGYRLRSLINTRSSGRAGSLNMTLPDVCELVLARTARLSVVSSLPTLSTSNGSMSVTRTSSFGPGLNPNTVAPNSYCRSGPVYRN
jgi:hypothetical protein